MIGKMGRIWKWLSTPSPMVLKFDFFIRSKVLSRVSQFESLNIRRSIRKFYEILSSPDRPFNQSKETTLERAAF